MQMYVGMPLSYSASVCVCIRRRRASSGLMLDDVCDEWLAVAVNGRPRCEGQDEVIQTKISCWRSGTK